MSVVALAGAKGSPGVTTTALALAAVWPRRVLIAECDPAGGDLACWFGLPAAPGMVTLGPMARRGLKPTDVLANTQVVAGSLHVLLGFIRPDQATALAPLWRELPAVFGGLPAADVLVDCGRLDPGSPTISLVHAADVALVLARPDAAGIAHLEPRLEMLARDGVAAEVVLVGERPYRPSEVRAALAERGKPADVVGTIVEDRGVARRLAGAPGSDRALGRSLLIRSARMLADAIEARLTERRAGVVPDARR